MRFVKYNKFMGKPFLIYGGTKQDRINLLKEKYDVNLTESPDKVVVEKSSEKKSIGIDVARKVKKFLQEKPLQSKTKIVIFTQAELLTTEAQNALLKILEEPPKYGQIFLLSKTENSLLETVVSRCAKIIVKHPRSEEIEDTTFISIDELLSLGDTKKFEYAEKLTVLEKDEIIEVLENWLRQLRSSKTFTQHCAAADLLTEVKESLTETNTNTKLSVEALLLNI